MTRKRRSAILRYVAISAINFAILLAGIFVGIALAPRVGTTVRASAQSPTIKAPAPPTAVAASVPKCNEDEYDCVAPAIGLGGPVVTNTLLANRIACDSLQTNGFDLLKINDAILSLLTSKGVITPSDVAAVVKAGKVAKPLRVKEGK